MGTRILVVDDSPTIRKVVARILGDQGFDTVTADNGDNALAELRRKRPDLVLVDFVMPKMNGYQFCREVRLDPALRDLPIVLMSAKAEKIRGQFVQQTGAIDAITKPFDPLALQAVIENALARHKSGQSDRPPALDHKADISAPHQIPSVFPKAADDDSVALSGDLSCISIAEVLQLLELQRQTGALRITTGSQRITLFIRDGLLDLAQARGLSGSFRLGRFLLQIGALTQEKLKGFLDGRTEATRLIGDALVQAALVTEEQVLTALKAQTSELVYEVVNWKIGRFSFVREVTCPEATLAQLGLVPGGILMEGFRRVDEWQLIEGSFDFDDVLQRDPLTAERSGDLAELTDAERTVLEAIDGERTVRQVVDLVPASTFDVSKILYQFLSSRLVRRRAGAA